MYDFLLTLRQESPHGGPFLYRSCETDVLGWICEAAAGVRMPELMSELLWRRIGAQNDAVIGIDAVGTGMFDGGINACLRDLVRFGSLYLTGGVSLTGQQVVPPAWMVSMFGAANVGVYFGTDGSRPGTEVADRVLRRRRLTAPFVHALRRMHTPCGRQNTVEDYLYLAEQRRRGARADGDGVRRVR